MRRRVRHAGALLGILALLLQASALLLHHTISPHTHTFSAADFDGTADLWAHDHADNSAVRQLDDHHKAPDQEPPACPVWTALHLIGGCVTPPAPALLLIVWVLLATFAVSSLPAAIFRTVGNSQPRAPPAPI